MEHRGEPLRITDIANRRLSRDLAGWRLLESSDARSTVEDKRESQSRPDSGIVTWHTEGFLADGNQGLVVDFRRSNLIPKRGIGK